MCACVWWCIWSMQQLCSEDICSAKQLCSAIENKHIYGKEAAETLRNNFYVDDLLKPVEDEDDAIHLIKKVRSVRLESGFNLTEFCSNSKRVLLSIPEEHRKAGIKNEDLFCNLPEEQPLGCLWKREEDLLGFNQKGNTVLFKFSI